jgi:hypothetical protein
VLLVCRADEEVARARLARRAEGEPTASDARLELWPALRAAFVEPTPAPDTVFLDSTRPLEALVEDALAVITS